MTNITTPLAPTDAELDALIDQHRWDTTEGRRDLTRAVLAKWGTPAPVGVEPVTADSVLADAARQGWKAGLCYAVEQMKGAAPAQPAEGAAGATPHCPDCGTHEVSIHKVCHNSACSKYGAEVTVHEGWKTPPKAQPATACRQRPIAYVDGDDVVRRILWEPNQAAFDIAVGTKLYAYQSPADAVDAERYRWLRRWKGQEHEPPFTVQHEIDGTLWGGDLDAAIDAARKQGANHD